VAYLDDPERTAETLTDDGFVRTGDAGFFDRSGHLRIIDRAKDVGKLLGGAMFAPKYIENKLKFFPNIKEAVAFGADRRFATAFINIDLLAVGNWAERNGISFASYQELAALPQIYDIVRGHIRQVNRDLLAEPTMAGATISRFVILHKELDADDGELTRTQKIRRAFVEDKYAALIAALYDGSQSCFVSTEVTFEDGRKGRIESLLAIADVDDISARAEVLTA
jgi:long-chain acyl-CoA synthetase